MGKCVNVSKRNVKNKVVKEVKEKKISVKEMRDRISELAVEEESQGMKYISLEELQGRSDIKDSIVSRINKSKKMIVLTGAGISCNAGIPDFRSSNGLYNQQLGEQDTCQKKVIGKEMFDISVYRSIETVKIFNKFMFELYQSVNKGQFTKTHQFIKELNDDKKLIKCYTQNIDGLERNCGLRTEFECNEWKDIDVVQLHGDLHQLCCNSCKENFKWEDVYNEEGKSKIVREFDETEYNDDDLMMLSQDSSSSKSESIFDTESVGAVSEEEHGIVECPRCVEEYERKVKLGKRSLESSIGIIRPNIVLYGEEHPFSETFGKYLSKDLNKRPNVLLIFGTSLKVSGVKALVRRLGKKVHEQEQGLVVLVNKEKVSMSTWGKVIDFQIVSDCDAFCEFLANNRSQKKKKV